MLSNISDFGRALQGEGYHFSFFKSTIVAESGYGACRWRSAFKGYEVELTPVFPAVGRSKGDKGVPRPLPP
jgi:hypothetical protein